MPAARTLYGSTPPDIFLLHDKRRECHEHSRFLHDLRTDLCHPVPHDKGVFLRFYPAST